MILSVSRRTDIPAVYSDWFFDALKAGEVLVPNPFIKVGKTAKIELKPIKIEKNWFGIREVQGNLEGIVFWTKNPMPMLARMDELEGIPYYFQFTLNAYGTIYERNLPPLEARIEAFVALSKRCPVVWRYDPIFFTRLFDEDWHIEQFNKIARRLRGSTKVCMINKLIGVSRDAYCPSSIDLTSLAGKLAKIALEYGIEVRACAEIVNLESVGIKKGRCLDPEIFENMLDAKVKKTKIEGSTRKGCGCMESVDIGAYSTCTNGCIYCYAVKKTVKPLQDLPKREVYLRKTDLSFDY